MIEVKKYSYNQFQETAKVLESGDEKKIKRDSRNTVST